MVSLLICKSFANPSMRAFATEPPRQVFHLEVRDWSRSLPLLRSRNDKRYKRVKGGNNLKSRYRSNALSSAAEYPPVSSESDLRAGDEMAPFSPMPASPTTEEDFFSKSIIVHVGGDGALGWDV